MQKIIRILSVFLYIAAGGVLAIYLFADFNPRIMIPPVSRLILLGVVCLSSYFAVFLQTKTATEENKKKIIKGLFIFYFALYIFLLLTFVLFDSFFGREYMVAIYNYDPLYLDNYLSNSVNLIPFKTVFEYITAFFNHIIPTHTVITNIFGNITAFIPFGFFVPIICKRKPSILKFTLSIVGVSLIIEVSQLILLVGSFDIDDIILNTLGAVISYLFFKCKIGTRIINYISLSKKTV